MQRDKQQIKLTLPLPLEKTILILFQLKMLQTPECEVDGLLSFFFCAEEGIIRDQNTKNEKKTVT